MFTSESMAEQKNKNAQVALLNTQLSEFAPTMPHNEAMKN